MNLSNLPLSRLERAFLVFFKKPVLWALMVCTGGATLMMVDGIAQTQMPNRPLTVPKSPATESVASNGPVISASFETRSDDSGR